MQLPIQIGRHPDITLRLDFLGISLTKVTFWSLGKFSLFNKTLLKALSKNGIRISAIFLTSKLGIPSIPVDVSPNDLITVVISSSVMSPQSFSDASLLTDGCTCS